MRKALIALTILGVAFIVYCLFKRDWETLLFCFVTTTLAASMSFN